MRFKNINIEERSAKYSDVQKESLQKISNSLNKIGDFFDVVVEFEKFIVKDIRKELNDYFAIRDNKDSIVNENGSQYYIDEVFLPVVEKLEERMTLAIENWNTERSDYSVDKLRNFIEVLKGMYSGIENLKGQDNIETFSAIQDLIDTFGNFVVYKSITTEDRAKRIENLFYLREEMENVEENISTSNGKKEKPKKKLTIDDL